MKKHELKRKISEAATKRYLNNRYFSIASLAESIGIKESEIHTQFKTRSSILHYYYTSRVLLYREQSLLIDGYNNYSLSEKLSNLFLTLIDLMNEEKEFVQKTYSDIVLKKECGKNSFRKELTNELNHIFSKDQRISAACRPLLNKYLFQTMYLQVHGLIWFWISDKSLNHENTLALVDKWCALTEEICYSRITDKSFDLLKFIAYNSPLKYYSSKNSK